MKKINLSILWHFHQPSYLCIEPEREYFFFPWVFLHSVREYYDMGRILLDSPENVKVTFNITPTLWYQIKKYIKGEFFDKWIEIYKKRPEDMDEEEKIFVLRNFFSLNYENQIFPYERYRYLLTKRGSVLGLEEKVKYFSNDEIRDICFYFLFSSFSEILKEENKILKEFLNKKKNFSEEDKEILLKIALETIKEVERIYKDLIFLKKVEITTSPFSHPILPLLIDSNSFEKSTPHLKNKKVEFSNKEDADRQIKMGLSYIEKEFNIKIKGIWPPEGAICENTLNLFIKNGIIFTFSCENVLSKSIKEELRLKDYVKRELYKPYLYKGSDGEIVVFFRDREISDRIGFVYKNYNEDDAINDFLNYLRKLKDGEEDFWVSVILDGENPWPYYKKGGILFLKKFYEALSKKDFIKFSFFEEGVLFEDKKSLRKIHPGSWIRGEFTTWMGDEEKNEGWEILKKVREDLKEKVYENEKSLFSMIFSEGSDFFWWLGYDNPTFYATEFDILFREHLKNVYRNLRLEYPLFLEKSIKGKAYRIYLKKPTGYVYPVIDGKITNFYEWANAGIIPLSKNKKSLLKYLYYGWDKDGNLCIRVDGIKDIEEIINEGYKIIAGIESEKGEIFVSISSKELIKREKIEDEIRGEIKISKLLEAKLKFAGKNIYLFLCLENKFFERYPEAGFYLLEKEEEEWVDFV
ncbi:MAG: glycoside hydrolase family 57 protein [candidate division WOR-3 bacterium]